MEDRSSSKNHPSGEDAIATVEIRARLDRTRFDTAMITSSDAQAPSTEENVCPAGGPGRQTSKRKHHGRTRNHKYSDDDSNQYDAPCRHRLVDDSDEDVSDKILFSNRDKGLSISASASSTRPTRNSIDL